MAKKIKRQELANLRQKLVLYNQSRNVQTGLGNPQLLSDANRYAKLVLHRHGANPKEYQIDPQMGEIVKREVVS